MWKPFEKFEKGSYPLIFLPKQIWAILNDYPPINAKYPYFKPEVPQKATLLMIWLNLVVLPIVGLLLLAEEISLTFAVTIFISLPVLLVLEMYFERIDYRKRCLKYQSDYQEYQKQLDEYVAEKDEKYNDAYTWVYQTYFIKEFFKSVKKPNIQFGNRKGLSEDNFGLTLNYWFPNKIFVNYSFEAPPSIIPYAPDFIYQDPDNNLHIDIEIDEPFSTAEKKPIHHLLDESFSMDTIRNDFFTEMKGWIVVRFAEKQVQTQKNQCCKVIAFIIYALTRDDTYLEKLKDFNYPDPVKQWTFDEARLMLNNKIKSGKLSPFGRSSFGNYFIEYGDKTQRRYSNWNQNIKLEPCADPYKDYGCFPADKLNL